jgi:hypothetical protein
MRKAMSLKLYAAGLLTASIAVAALAVPPAEAQSRKQQQQQQQQQQQYVYVTTRDGTVVRRARSRVRVAPRSFLDPGTEVRPGERKFTEYALPTGYSAFDILVNNTAGFHRSPLLGRFDLPSNNNPYGW